MMRLSEFTKLARTRSVSRIMKSMAKNTNRSRQARGFRGQGNRIDMRVRRERIRKAGKLIDKQKRISTEAVNRSKPNPSKGPGSFVTGLMGGALGAGAIHAITPKSKADLIVDYYENQKS